MDNQSPKFLRKKLLVVEDDLRRLLVSIISLSKVAPEVFTAERADQAVMLARSIDFNLIVMDIRLPGFGRTDSGIEAIRRIREFNREVPILVISAYPDAYKKSSLQVGANQFLAKTSAPDEILTVVEGYLLGR